MAKLICEEIKPRDLSPLDLLTNGIIQVSLLQRNQLKLYNSIISRGYQHQITRHNYSKKKLTVSEKSFIRKHIKTGYCRAPMASDCSTAQVQIEIGKYYNAMSSFLTQISLIWNYP